MGQTIDIEPASGKKNLQTEQNLGRDFLGGHSSWLI
jgi:hypothetical protein